MPAARGYEPCYVALIDSKTLQFEPLIVPLGCASFPDGIADSIPALINRLGDINRRRFILALITDSSFSCSVSCSGAVLSAGLYRIDSIGSSWSHLLVMRNAHHTPTAHCSPVNIDPQPAVPDICRALYCMHDYNRMAARSLFSGTPAVTKRFLDSADTLCGRLLDMICGKTI